MGLDTIHSTLAGRVMVEGDVHDIIHRLEHGDPVLGWDGDPSLSLVANIETGEFEVWAVDAHGQDYIAISHPRCDASLIRRLVAADNRRESVVDRVARQNAAAERAQAQAAEDQLEQMADRLQFGLMRDIGHRHGGLTRRIH